MVDMSRNADLFKASSFDHEFKKLLDSGQFIFVDRHLVLNDKKYIARNQSGNATLSEYALSHMDECCADIQVHLLRRW